MQRETIHLFDGEKEVELELVATFGLDEQDYCLVQDPEEEDPFFLRFEAEGDDLLFSALESDEELEEVKKAYEELIEKPLGGKEREEKV